MFSAFPMHGRFVDMKSLSEHSFVVIASKEERGTRKITLHRDGGGGWGRK